MAIGNQVEIATFLAIVNHYAHTGRAISKKKAIKAARAKI